MNADAEHPEPSSPEEETLARHKRLSEVLSGQRRMGWPDWKDMSIYESTCLAPGGRSVALWAVDVLQRALGDDFLSRVEDWLARMRSADPDLAPDLHPILSLGLWPANDVPWVYANLIRLAAYIYLFNPGRPQNRFGHVLYAANEDAFEHTKRHLVDRPVTGGNIAGFPFQTEKSLFRRVSCIDGTCVDGTQFLLKHPASRG